MALIYDDYLKSAQEASKAYREKAIADSDALYANQASALKETYNGQIADTEKAYEDKYRENAIQKLINERQVAENMANMGLTDSGLNRSQQTAVQLSYGNNKLSIDRQRQAQVDALARELASSLSTVEQNRLAAAADINKEYDQFNIENATSAYNSAIQASSKVTEQNDSAEDEETTFYYTYTGQQKIDDYGNVLNVYYDNSGKQKTVMVGVNPYTGHNNLKEYAAEKKAGIKFASNGYQPLGLVSQGGNFSKVTVGNQVVQYNYKGKPQNIWYAPKTGNYFLWDGSINQYVPVSSAQVEQIKQMYTAK